MSGRSQALPVCVCVWWAVGTKTALFVPSACPGFGKCWSRLQVFGERGLRSWTSCPFPEPLVGSTRDSGPCWFCGISVGGQKRSWRNNQNMTSRAEGLRSHQLEVLAVLLLIPALHQVHSSLINFPHFCSFQTSPHFRRRRKPYLEILWTKVSFSLLVHKYRLCVFNRET